MFQDLLASILLTIRFAGYKPYPVNPWKVIQWLSPFSPEERKLLIKLANSVRFVSESELARALIAENAKLVKKLNYYGIPNSKIIYIQFDEAASSSAVTLALLRDRGLLERFGFKWMDYGRISELHRVTSKLEEGAVIFVDDFIGSGTQFKSCHEFCREFIVGNFSQFLLAGCICEEAFKILDEQNIEPVSFLLHGRKDRPLLGNTQDFTVSEIDFLKEICKKVADNGSSGLGFGEMAAMVVFYRNAPNNLPFALRGTIGQSPFKGLLPRTTDLVSRIQAAQSKNT